MFFSYYRDEEETPNDPTGDETRILLAFIKAPTKMVNPREETVESPKLEEVAESPRAPPKKKSKKNTANKGIKISENLPVPSMDDVSLLSFHVIAFCRPFEFLYDCFYFLLLQPIAREMMDMAIRYIGFREEALELLGKNFCTC